MGGIRATGTKVQCAKKTEGKKRDLRVSGWTDAGGQVYAADRDG